MRLTKEKFVELMNIKFNNKFILTLPEVFTGHSIITGKCNEHGEFSTTGHTMLASKYGCKVCAATARSVATSTRNKSHLTSWESRIANFREIHGDCYTYPENHTGNYRSKIQITCPAHGTFSKHIFAHINGSGCQECRKENTKKYKKTLIDQAAKSEISRENRISANKKRIVDKDELAQSFYKVHGTKFTYDWESYTGKSKKIRIICGTHGEFWQSCVEHLQAAHGCPICAISAKSKKQEDWLDIHNISIRQHRIHCNNKLIIVDGYDATTNTVYEFLGDYWHGHPRWYDKCDGINPTNKIPFVELFKITEDRLTLLHNMQYNVVYVWENDNWVSTTTTRLYNGKLES